MNSLAVARLVNKAHGGAVMTAMEVEQLSDDWVDFFEGVMVTLPKKQERERRIRQKFEQFEREHPTYGQRFKN